MAIQLVTITGPTTPPVTTAEAKLHLRVTHSNEDAYIGALVDAARLVVEGRTGYRLFTQTVELRADSWNDPGLSDPGRTDVISLRVAPVASITSVKYFSSSDTDTTLSSSGYWADLTGVPARIQTKTSWPSTNGRIGNIRVRLVAGTAVDSVPQIFKEAVLLLVGHYYVNREQVTDIKLHEIPEGINSIILNNPEYWHMSTGSM